MKRKTFTLIELMTVITIFALMMSLLMPALQKSLAKAHQADCSSNLRQLQMAFIGYGADHEYRMPPYVRNSTYLHAGTNWARYTLPYYGDTRLLNCPASIQGAPAPTQEALHLYDGNYGWNYDGTQFNRGPLHSWITQPSEAYLLFDSGDQCVIYGGNTWENLMEELDLDFDSGPEGTNRHLKKTNIAFVDGHVAARSLKEFLAAPNPSNSPPWYIQWDNGILQPDTIPFPDR